MNAGSTGLGVDIVESELIEPRGAESSLWNRILEGNMYPYLHLGPLTLGTFGILLWLGAVAATVILHKNFQRFSIDADALNVVAFVTIAGVLGAKAYHELQDPAELADSMRRIMLPGWHHPGEILMYLLKWFQAGFAWFGGLCAGIAMLLWQGRQAKFQNGARVGGLRMLDLAAPAAAIGYGVGRLGCLLSGDGDYGKSTKLPWGVHIRNDALDPPVPNPPELKVHPTPVYELGYSLVFGLWLWHRAKKNLPIGQLTGEYLVLTGIARWFVELIRINPRVHLGMSNAQVAALGSILAGIVLILWSKARSKKWVAEAEAVAN